MVNFIGSAAEGEHKANGKPSAIAIVAAREKLSTEVTEITVDARQRVKAFSIIWYGAVVSW